MKKTHVGKGEKEEKVIIYMMRRVETKRKRICLQGEVSYAEDGI